MIRHVAVWQTRERLNAGQQSVGKEHDRTLYSQQRHVQTATAVIRATDADIPVQLIIIRWCPNFFSLAGRQVFQAQIRHRAGAHYYANADEKRAAREERICSRLYFRRPPIRQLNRPTGGGAHALDDGDQAWHEPTDAFTDHVRNQVYVWIPGQRRYEQNRTSAPDQCHGERERTEHDTVWLTEHNARHVV